MRVNFFNSVHYFNTINPLTRYRFTLTR